MRVGAVVRRVRLAVQTMVDPSSAPLRLTDVKNGRANFTLSQTQCQGSLSYLVVKGTFLRSSTDWMSLGINPTSLNLS